MNTYIYSPEHIAYVTFRAEWRAKYKSLSLEIRELKAEIRRLFKDEKPMRASMSQADKEAMSRHATLMMGTITVEKAKWKELLAKGHVCRIENPKIVGAA